MNEVPAKKASQDVGDSDIVRIIDDKRVHFVSRSAMKLDAFLDEIQLNIQEKICLDIGASTGGFTQVLLLWGAKSVCTVDVGTLQLHPSLRKDSRVICVENMDIRNFQTELVFDLIVWDISFISLTKLMDSIWALTHPETEIILLYKPQFEVGPENLRKTWVPKSAKIVEKKFGEFQDFLMKKEFLIKKISCSILKGEAGNKEYMMWIKKKS